MSGTFGFQYPWLLLGLFTIPILALWFLIQQRHYWHDAFAFSQISVLQSLRHNRRQVWVQRILPGLLLLAMTSGILGLAHPVWKTLVITRNTYLMLVLDISISMEATDLSPNRLEAARKAAIGFTQNLPDGVQMGLTFFAGNSYLVSPPTDDHNLLVNYLKSLDLKDLRPGTAIGDALLTALEGLTIQTNPTSPELPSPRALNNTSNGALILLTDGENNIGVPPQVAIEEANRQRVSVFTVGMGEETGAYVRGGIFTRLDEPALMTIAQQTGGNYYRARSYEDFKGIYQKIGQKTLGFEEQKRDLSPWFLGVCVVVLLFAFGWSTRYRRF